MSTERVHALVALLERPDPPPLADLILALVLERINAARQDVLDTDEIPDLVTASAATAILVRDQWRDLCRSWVEGRHPGDTVRSGD